jgi:hypothetical protein
MIADFSIAPVGKGESLSADVAEAFKIIAASGVTHEHHAMGTNLEGDWDEVHGRDQGLSGEDAAVRGSRLDLHQDRRPSRCGRATPGQGPLRCREDVDSPRRQAFCCG